MAAKESESMQQTFNGLDKLKCWKRACVLFALCAVAKSLPAQTLTTVYGSCQDPQCTSGSGPEALIQATDGNFLGGGNNTATRAPLMGTTCGTIFKISPIGTLTSLCEFCSLSRCLDGSYYAFCENQTQHYRTGLCHRAARFRATCRFGSRHRARAGSQ